MIALVPGEAKAATSIPKYHSIPAYQYKDVYATTRVKIENISVNVTAPVKFLIFNSTTQEVEQTVYSQNGKLPTLNLIKDHNYIFFAEDSDYTMDNVYVWVKGANNIVDIKKNCLAEDGYNYPKVTSLELTKRSSSVANPEDRRVTVHIPVHYGSNVEARRYDVSFKLVSDVETITTTTEKDGYLTAGLLEDVTYIVIAENDQYTVDPFPIVYKDKSEYNDRKWCYNHSNCNRVDDIQLIDKADAHKNDTTVTSLSGNTVVSGFKFDDLLIVDKTLDKSTVSGMNGKDYDVLAISAVNPHRWEISKLVTGNFNITEKISSGKTVKNVYYVDKSGTLQNIDFQQKNQEINFTMHSLSLYPVVIEYEPGSTMDVKIQKIALTGISNKIAAGSKITLKATIKPTNSSDKGLKWKSSNSKVATVNSKGVVTLKRGTGGKKVTITATAKDGSGKKATYQITSMKGVVKKVTISGAKSVKAGKTLKLKGRVTASKGANTKLKWSSSNTKYATVTSSGKVTAKKGGKGKTVTITAQATDGSGKKKAVKIKIK
jgi:hypothetical protein